MNNLEMACWKDRRLPSTLSSSLWHNKNAQRVHIVSVKNLPRGVKSSVRLCFLRNLHSSHNWSVVAPSNCCLVSGHRSTMEAFARSLVPWRILFIWPTFEIPRSWGKTRRRGSQAQSHFFSCNRHKIAAQFNVFTAIMDQNTTWEGRRPYMLEVRSL